MDYSDCVGKKRGGRESSRLNKILDRSPSSEGAANGLSKANKTVAMDPKVTPREASGRASTRSNLGKFARGGAVKTPKTNISINISTAPKPEDKGAGLLDALKSAAPPPPPPPPMPPPGGPPIGLGGPPPGLGGGPGGPGGMIPGMKIGGRAAPKMDGGAGGALGRLEKAEDLKRNPKNVAA